jgi:hypothetical protein
VQIRPLALDHVAQRSIDVESHHPEYRAGKWKP